MQSGKDMDLCDETLTLRGNETLIIYIDISCTERLINIEATRGPGSIPNGGNIFSFFYIFRGAGSIPTEGNISLDFFPT